MRSNWQQCSCAIFWKAFLWSGRVNMPRSANGQFTVICENLMVPFMATITVTELVWNFAAACRALVPSLDRAAVAWRDSEQYDNWDRIAEPLFESLVIEPCAFHAVGEVGLEKMRTARYGFAPAEDSNAWVALGVAHPAWLINLSSIAKPFDHVRCSEPAGLVPLDTARFVFVYEADDGSQRQLEQVNLAAE
jgi:hypothetical protein